MSHCFLPSTIPYSSQPLTSPSKQAPPLSRLLKTPNTLSHLSVFCPAKR